jgi:hypothetical protein
MRIKFNKGMTPDDIANMFVRLMNDRNALIGTVNIYVQEYNEELKAVRDEEYMEVKPTKYGLMRYGEYSVGLRRSKLKVV